MRMMMARNPIKPSKQSWSLGDSPQIAARDHSGTSPALLEFSKTGIPTPSSLAEIDNNLTFGEHPAIERLRLQKLKKHIQESLKNKEDNFKDSE